MCIRDRTYPELKAIVGQIKEENRKNQKSGKAVAAGGKRGSTAQQLADKANTCLLYTSDAADERSSVDLGGRRIIKKKKRREIEVLDVLEYKTKQIVK